MRRKRFQKGSLQARKHGRHRVWVACWWEDGGRKSKVLGRCSLVGKGEAGSILSAMLHPINSGVAKMAKPVCTFEQFITEVHWGDPEFLLIDMPPGTGDVALSVAQHLPAAELYVVTTPQPAAERVAKRAGALARELRLSVRGVIENMSWFTGPDGARLELFGAGGGADLAAELGVELLAQVPFDPAVRAGADEGRPAALVDAASDVAKAFDALAARVVALGPSRIYRRELNIT